MKKTPSKKTEAASATIVVNLHGDVLELHLNRPEVHNALNLETVHALTKVFKDAAKNKQLRLVTIRGNGNSFCAGGDVNWMRQSVGAKSAAQRRDSQALADMYEAIWRCPVPILGVAHGNVLGGGVGLVATCDIVAVERSTRFAFSEVRLGIIPSVISVYVLAKAAATQAVPLMLTGEVFGSERAQQLGLVHHVGTSEECEAYAQSVQTALLANPPEALRLVKRLARELPEKNWAAKRRFTIELNAQVRASKEGQEGMRAFLEKRPPSWSKR